MSFGYSDSERKVKELIDRSYYLSDGDEKIMMLEEAVRLADAANNLKLQFDAREAFIEAAYFGGIPEKAMVAYAWCLAQYDREPARFREWNILWRYKWMVNVVCDFPQISKEQIYGMLDDMERRFQAAGRGLRAVYKYRYRTERFFGNRAEAIRLYELAERTKKDDLTDCNACEIDERVNFNLYVGNDALALRIAEPLLEGRQKCRTVPQRTYARLLVPLLRLGRRDEAWDFYSRSYYMLSQDRSMLDYLSDHFFFLSLYGDLEEAARILENHYHWTEENTNRYERFVFYRAAWLFLETAIEAGENWLNLRMPRSFPLYDSSHFYATPVLKEWFEERARALAAKFDARNGTDHFTKRLLDLKAIRELQHVV
jgi:hypothetical protein